MRTIVFPPPLSMKGLPEHVRRGMRAFERVHKMLEAKAAAERGEIKIRSRRRTAKELVAEASKGVSARE